MQTRDHLELGYFLLAKLRSPALDVHARAFLLGCVEADYNCFSYLRGFLRHKKFYGHNAENTRTYIENRIGRIQSKGLRSAWDYFRLGVMLHYLADAFTAPHNAFWSDNLAAHKAYEKKLHRRLAGRLNGETAKPPAPRLPDPPGGDVPASPLQCFRQARQNYAAANRSMETDCLFILQTCAQTLGGCLRYARRGAEPIPSPGARRLPGYPSNFTPSISWMSKFSAKSPSAKVPSHSSWVNLAISKISGGN